MTTTEVSVGMTIAPGLYRHKSGGLYTVFCVVRHHETGNPMVVYYSHGHGSMSTRPLFGFVGPRCSDPDGFAERFVLIRNPGADLPAEVVWTNNTLLRNFGLFEAVLAGAVMKAIDPTRTPEGEPNVGAAPNTSDGAMDPESSIGRL